MSTSTMSTSTTTSSPVQKPPHIVHLKCQELMTDFLDDASDLKSRVKVIVRLFPKTYGCLRISISMYKYGVEATEIKTSRRINSGNLANAHMFFARAEHLPVSIHNRTVLKMETFTEMEGGSMESAVAFDIIDSDDSEDGATTIAIRGQIDSVVNTLDTYDNPTSDSDNTQTNDVQDNANPNNNANGNQNSDVDFDADEMTTRMTTMTPMKKTTVVDLEFTDQLI